MPEIVEGLAVGKREDDDEVIWLFVVLRAGADARRRAWSTRIQRTIRTEESPRHVPKRILQVSELPRTRSGKSMEIAVTQLVNGRPVPNRMVVANPASLDEIEAAVAGRRRCRHRLEPVQVGRLQEQAAARLAQRAELVGPPLAVRRRRGARAARRSRRRTPCPGRSS